MPDPVPVARLVLVVDPDADTRALYRAALTSIGYEVEEAEDGRDALVKALSCPPLAIIAETRLPFVTGFELCQLLCTDAETSAVRMVFVTGDSDALTLERAFSVGAAAVLLKPCPVDTLLLEIERLDHERHHLRTIGPRPIDSDPSVTAHRPASRTHERSETTHPPRRPPELRCPSCARTLEYRHSNVGGVSQHHPEQWDYFVCGTCGAFQYRQRTGKIRRVG